MRFKVDIALLIGLFLVSASARGGDPTAEYETRYSQIIANVLSAAQMDLDALLGKFHTEDISFRLVEVDRPQGYYSPMIHLAVKLPKKRKSISLVSEAFLRFRPNEGVSVDAVSGAIQAFALTNAFVYLRDKPEFATSHFQKVTSQLHSAIPYREALLEQAGTIKLRRARKFSLEDISIRTYIWIVDEMAKRNKTSVTVETVSHWFGDMYRIKSGGDPTVTKMETVNIRLPDKSIFSIDVFFHDYDYIAPDESENLPPLDVQKHHQAVTALNFFTALDTALIFNPYLRKQMKCSAPTVWKNTFSDELGTYEYPTPSEIVLAEVSRPEIRFRMGPARGNLAFLKRLGDNRFEFSGPRGFFPGVKSGDVLDLKVLQDRVSGLAWVRIPEQSLSVFYLAEPRAKSTLTTLQASLELWTSPAGIGLFGQPAHVLTLPSVNSEGDPQYRTYSMKELNDLFQQECSRRLVNDQD